jgi:hypothetical protein
VATNGGNVTVTADIRDPNVGETFSVEWSASDASVANISDQANAFVFDPVTVASGVYSISVTVSDIAQATVTKLKKCQLWLLPNQSPSPFQRNLC